MKYFLLMLVLNLSDGSFEILRFKDTFDNKVTCEHTAQSVLPELSKPGYQLKPACLDEKEIEKFNQGVEQYKKEQEQKNKVFI